MAVAMLLAVVPAMAKKSGKDERIMVKAWFKDGTVAESLMTDHWKGYGPSFLIPTHKFKLVVDENGKTRKYKAHDVDSVLILDSTHRKFKAGEMYVAFNGKTNALGGRPFHKLLLREAAGRHVDLCRMPYVGNCVISGKNIDQWMEYWFIRFRDTGRAVIFFDNPTGRGCHKPYIWVKWFSEYIAKDYPGLAEAIDARFRPDKEASQESADLIAANPRVFFEFVDDYLSSQP